MVGARLGRAAHILLGYTPTYTGGISLGPEPRTRRPFPALELYVQEPAGPSRPNNRRRNRQDHTVTVAAQQGEVDLPGGIPQVRLSDTGASSFSRVTLISPSDYFADPDMSRRLNLAAMVGRSGSRVPSASPGSTPSTRATSSCSPSGLLIDARHKRSHQDAFGGEEDEDLLSLHEFQELNAASARTLSLHRLLN